MKFQQEYILLFDKDFVDNNYGHLLKGLCSNGC